LDDERDKIEEENFRSWNNNITKKFEDFFIYTFTKIAPTTTDPKITIKDPVIPEPKIEEPMDDVETRVFKRDVLLSWNWEFSSIIKIVDIKANNIIAKKISSLSYSIKIKDAKFKNYDMSLNWDYNIDKKEFKNIVLKNKSFKIIVNENISLDDFKKKIWLLLEKYEKINTINSNLVNYTFKNIDINFYSSDNTLIISANNDKKWDFYVEIRWDWNLNYANLKGKNLIKGNKSYDNFILNLPTILK
jgi:hypothetical protein